MRAAAGWIGARTHGRMESNVVWAPHAAAKDGVTGDRDETTTDLTVSLRTQEAAGSFHLGQGGEQPACEMNKLVLQEAAVPGSREAKLLSQQPS